MKINIKSIVLQLIILLLCFSLLTVAGEIETKFINKPWEQLTPEEKLLNRVYIEKAIKETEKEIVSVLIEKLKDPRFCYLSRETIIDIGTSIIPSLREVVKNKKNNFITRTEALKILKEIGDKKAFLLVEDEIKPIPLGYNPEQDEFQKTYLQMKLEGLPESEKIDMLIEMLKEKNKSRLARESLIEIGTTTVPILVEVLEDKNNLFISRLDALWSLKEIKDKRCVPTVIKILKDSTETDHLRELSAYTVGELGDKRAIFALEEVIRTWKPGPETDVYNVAETAKQALKKIGEKDVP